MDVSQVTSNNNFGYYGRITKVEMIDSGSGYNGTPTVPISAPTNGDKGIQELHEQLLMKERLSLLLNQKETKFTVVI